MGGRKPMHALDGERILMAWERGRDLQEPWRALALLKLALPEWDTAALAALPLAERNALLLRLRTMTFGAHIEGFAVCPQCGAQLEFALNAQDLERHLQTPSEDKWLEDGIELRMRPANSSDLAASMAVSDEEDARALLLRRTVGHAETADITPEQQGNRSEWPSEWIERFDRLNASAEIRCVLSCSECGNQPALDMDIARFLWREVALAARRLFAEIHMLARAYGWSEQAITAMSPARRATYLEMLNA